jgi:hypothetical protein
MQIKSTDVTLNIYIFISIQRALSGLQASTTVQTFQKERATFLSAKAAPWIL